MRRLFLVTILSLLLPGIASSKEDKNELNQYLDAMDSSALKIPMACEINTNELRIPLDSKIDLSLLKLFAQNTNNGYFLLQIKDVSKTGCEIVTTDKKLSAELLNNPVAKKALIQIKAIMKGIFCSAVFPILNQKFSQFKNSKSTKVENEYTLEKDRNTLKINMKENKTILLQMAPNKVSFKKTEIEYLKQGTALHPNSFNVETSQYGEKISGFLGFNMTGDLSTIKANVQGLPLSQEYKLENCKTTN